MLALFMIALLLWILSAGITAFTAEQTGSKLKDKDVLIASLQNEINSLKKTIEQRDQSIVLLEEKIRSLEKMLGGGKDAIKELERLRDDNIKLREHLAALQAEHDNLLTQLAETKANLEKVTKENNAIKDALGEGKDINVLLENLEKLKKELNDKPPVINLTEGVAKEFSFPSGNAELPETFKKRLFDETFPELQNILKRYERIDTLEIVGHTDGRPLNRKGNLDSAIPKLMNADADKIALIPGSNTDLGLMRALAIRNAWLKWIDSRPEGDQTKLKSIAIRCYSAAQTVPPGEVGREFDWLSENESARRIEIRFIQLK